MQQWSRRLGLLATIGLASGSMVLLVGCADDLYGTCYLDPNSPDQQISNCGRESSVVDTGCVVSNQVQCDTRVCGRYQGSDAFCTKLCTSDGDCPGGFCDEFVFQSGERYCAPSDLN